MQYIKCPQFMIGGPSPANWYADRLSEAYREICQFYKEPAGINKYRLEPLWHFCETVAMTRMFSGNRKFYDFIDKKIDRMGRSSLIKLALRAFLTPALTQYLQALRSGGVFASDAVMFYLRLRVTLEWMEDNTVIIERYVSELDTLMNKFRSIAVDNGKLLSFHAKYNPGIKKMWQEIVKKADPRFVKPLRDAI